MYERYWKFERAPFDHDRRPDSFYSGRFHGEALVKMKYLIEHGKGAAALVGASGTGKTHILEMVRHSVSQGPVVHIVYPQLSAHELVSFLTTALDDSIAESNHALPGLDILLQKFEKRLCDLTADGHSPVVMLDDAHLIEDRRVFQALHQLMNFQRPGRSNFTLILCGQPELVSTLQRMDQLSDRIAFQCVLQSLTREESDAYVKHRLESAGRHEPIFDDSALQAIYELSAGIPRRINRLCDFALLVGYASRFSRVSAEQIEGVYTEITQSQFAA